MTTTVREKSRLKSLKDMPVAQKRVLVRVDFNVPLDKRTGAITDDSRIQAALSTIRYLVDNDAKVILASHLGRPKGQIVESLSLRPVADRLSELLGLPVKLATDSIGSEVRRLVDGMRPGEIVLLENLRFHAAEEKNDPAFVEQLAALADVYVNDAFGTAHRAHASTEGVAHKLPSAAGFLMEREVEALGSVLENPERPFTAIIGGAKISSKIGVLKNLLGKVDRMIIGGGMANTFFAAQGYGVGSSLVESDQIPVAKQLLASPNAGKLLLPLDVVITQDVSNASDTRAVGVDEVPEGWAIVDIGPATIRAFGEAIDDSRTILWNGPMGIFEVTGFAHGTLETAKRLAESSGQTIVGGGDSVAALEQTGLANRMTHVSTGGGASLEFLEGITLPGIKVLQEAA